MKATVFSGRYKTLILCFYMAITFQQCSQKTTTTASSGTQLEYTCDELVVTDYDRISGATKSGTRNTIIVSQDKGRTGFAIDLYLIKGILAFSIHSEGTSKCINKDDLIYFRFADGSTLELPNNGDFNCEADFALYFGGLFGNRDAAEILISKEIKSMKLTTSEGSLEKSLSQSQGIQLMRTFECMEEDLIW